ncbi:MAG: hypothetical protein GY809_30335, partial [Planctomycetes bacterium]|nr:hypothetical protein [Planctomycetota bacterium]
ATADESTQFSAGYTSGQQIAQTDILSQDGMISMLESLETHAHPEQALAEFLTTGDDDDATDKVLVTHEDVLSDPDFRQYLSDCNIDMLYIATVGRQGRYTLQSCCRLGLNTIHEAHLDLDCILKAPPGQQTDVLLRDDHDPNLPVILSVEPFPLRMPHSVKWDQTIQYESGKFLAIAKGNRIMQWMGDKLGAHQITDRLPAGHVLWAKPAGPNYAYLIIQSNDRTNTWVVTIDLKAGSCILNRIQLSISHAMGACILGGKLCLLGRKDVAIYSGPTLAQSQTLALPHGTEWYEGKFFRIEDKYHVLGLRAGELYFEEIPHHFPDADPAQIRMVRVFEREGMTDPWVVYSNGHICSLDKNREPFI